MTRPGYDDHDDDDLRQYLYKTACDSCGSSDANAIYSDGGSHCFSCQAHVKGEDDWATNAPQHVPSPPTDLVKGEAQDLRARRLTQATCDLWRYWVGHYNGQPVHIANYSDHDRRPVAQKLRFRDKDSMPWLGKKADAAPLYGQWLWPSSGRMVVITEGEIDALSVSQAFGNKWPVVSVPSGAAGAHKDVRKAIDWLSGFDKVVLAFDMDEPGQEAAIACAKLLPPGKARIATLPKKDASDMLQAGMVRELTHALHNAREYRPDGIVSVSDIRDEALTPKPEGHPWFIPEMTRDTHGVHPGNLVTIGAGCVDGDTEYLSPTGWHSISSYTDGEVAQYHEDGSISFVTPLEFVRGGAANALHIDCKYGLDMVLTGGHRVVYRNEDRDTLKVKPAAECFTPGGPGFRGCIPTAFSPTPNAKGLPFGLSEAELRLQIAVEADGYECPQSLGKKSHTVRIKRARKIGRLVRLLSDSQTPYTVRVCQGYYVFRFPAPLRKGTLYAGNYPEWSKEACQVVADETPRWDGDNDKTFRTTIKRSADAVQFCFHAIGKRACISARHREDKGHTEYRVVSTSRDHVYTRNTDVKVRHIDAHYCFRVPTGMLVMRRSGRVFVTGNTGVGKTDFLAEQIAFQTTEAEEKVGAIFLETPPTDLLQIVAGKTVDMPLTVPDGRWDKDDLRRGIDNLDNGRLHLYDSWGATDWDTIRSTITYMAVAQGCKHIYLDHLTALAALVDDEKKALEGIMAELAGLAQQNSVVLWIVSHLATPDGKPHEEGGRVTIRHFKGSRAIGFWSHIMIGLERDQQAEDDWERTLTTVRILKYRPNGSAVGKTYRMSYDYTTGRLTPSDTTDDPLRDFEGTHADDPPASPVPEGVSDF